MRVTIDTKHDSLEEIKKVVALLSEMIYKQSGSSSSALDFNLPAGNSNSTDTSSGGMMNMFDLPEFSTSSNKQETVNSSDAPFGSLAGIFNTAGGAGNGRRTEEKDEKNAYSYSGEAKMEVY